MIGHPLLNIEVVLKKYFFIKIESVNAWAFLGAIGLDPLCRIRQLAAVRGTRVHLLVSGDHFMVRVRPMLMVHVMSWIAWSLACLGNLKQN